jgi:hypothetical protein
MVYEQCMQVVTTCSQVVELKVPKCIEHVPESVPIQVLSNMTEVMTAT